MKGRRFFYVWALLAWTGIETMAWGKVLLGIDVLRQHGFRPLRGKRIGLITNQTGVDAQGRPTRVILQRAPGVHLVCLFAPEHGILGTAPAGKSVGQTRDPLTGLRVYSLYGRINRPTSEMLRGLDALVFDVQDIGCRSYTYLSTMLEAMKAAGENGIEFVVLDRPNPLGGERVEGPLVEARWTSFVSPVPVPYVHGMTAGEIAKMANAKGWVQPPCRLSVIPMEGWSRDMTWEDTGLRWIRTSPNIPYPRSPAYYVVTGLVGELCGVDVGIGTKEPFQYFLVRHMDPHRLAAQLNSWDPGRIQASVRPVRGGKAIFLTIHPKTRANLCELAVYLLSEANVCGQVLSRSRPSQINLLYKEYGSSSIRAWLAHHSRPSELVRKWAPGVATFRKERARFLLYPEHPGQSEKELALQQ
ncbi:exo-beta-N-acetylmuramidase NamZ family protein [Candidatus Methylacidithermus pantelleriae]|uniref:Alternate gene name: yzbB n=1 Tax=Candidatus Methylacidithermus pantelleriae TaxID=2744239 RepID=A0A8J2BGY7_9BACT|nr:DUF1343 domain-containing protein [Candidatus Methylacidithermus pantelleriae]CAF0693032.1 alternate gene name: yzbB [Candidatus Methylacidithermus pantelleriae]